MLATETNSILISEFLKYRSLKAFFCLMYRFLNLTINELHFKALHFFWSPKPLSMASRKTVPDVIKHPLWLSWKQSDKQLHHSSIVCFKMLCVFAQAIPKLGQLKLSVMHVWVDQGSSKFSDVICQRSSPANILDAWRALKCAVEMNNQNLNTSSGLSLWTNHSAGLQLSIH